MPEYIFLIVAFLFAGWVQGLVGFGFAVTTTLVLVNHVEFTVLVFLNLCISLMLSTVAMLSAHNLRALHRKTLIKLVVSATAGILVGIAIINVTNAVVLKKIALAAILLASLVSLTRSRVFFSHNYISWLSGFFSGVLTPSTGINGPLVALHLNAAFKNKDQTRSTMLSYLLLIMLFGVISMSISTELSPGTGGLLLRLGIPSLCGYGLGLLTFKKLADHTFRKLVTIFLIVSSIASLTYLIV